ncbi:tripartite tricarboxylate transporter TctB family protein [Paenibacillus sp. JMULE4]|nr:tripartite tricarboxylate transporter TctB family protein [Paenibacillus sp. JMULE4]
MMRQNAGVWAAIFIFLFGLMFFWMSLSFDYMGPEGPGPGLLPLWLSGLLIILSVVYMMNSIKHITRFKDILPRGKGFINIVTIIGSFLLFLLTVKSIGFVMAGTLFLFILLAREYQWYAGLGISIGISIILFWVFCKLLSVPIPVNAWGW